MDVHPLSSKADFVQLHGKVTAAFLRRRQDSLAHGVRAPVSAPHHSAL